MTLDEVDLLDELEKILCSHKSISSEEKDKLRQHGFIFSIGRALYNLSKENDALRKKNQQLIDQMEEQDEVVDHDGFGKGLASGNELVWALRKGWVWVSGGGLGCGRGDGHSSGWSYTGGEGDGGGWGYGFGERRADGAGLGDGCGTASGTAYGEGWGLGIPWGPGWTSGRGSASGDQMMDWTGKDL